MNKHNFNEKDEEYINGDYIPVWVSPKYEETRKKVVEMIESGKYGLTDNDFWILMNKTSRGDKMAYTGLIISHNGCLKINDNLEDKLKFKPSCVRENQNGYEGSLVYTYLNDEQGIYEVGEISESNYKQKTGRYPYAMAFKRLFDRVVLKNSKLSYSGVYSDSEAEEFKDKNEEIKTPKKDVEDWDKIMQEDAITKEIILQPVKTAINNKIISEKDMLDYFKIKSIDEMNYQQVEVAKEIITKRENKINKSKEEVF